MGACTERYLGTIGSATLFLEVFHTKFKKKRIGKANRSKFNLTWFAGALLGQNQKLEIQQSLPELC